MPQRLKYRGSTSGKDVGFASLDKRTSYTEDNISDSCTRSDFNDRRYHVRQPKQLAEHAIVIKGRINCEMPFVIDVMCTIITIERGRCFHLRVVVESGDKYHWHVNQ